jgi:hypothetical protein
LLRKQIAREIGVIDLLQQVDNCIRPVVGGVLKPIVEVPNNKGDAVYGAHLPCHLEIAHPCCTVWGDADFHDVIPLVACDKLEGQ